VSPTKASGEGSDSLEIAKDKTVYNAIGPKF
jgi:hypothetical protein